MTLQFEILAALPESINIASFMVNMGFVGWLSWYLMTKVIPRMQQQFSIDLKSQRDEAVKILDREKEFWAKMMDQIDERSKRMEDLIKELSHLKGP